jgi:hypothetical protein
VVVAILIVATAAGYWAYSEYRKRELHERVAALVSDTTGRLRAALSEGSAGNNLAQFIRRVEDHATEIDRRLADLRTNSAVANRALVDAAELYGVSAREILRRMASSERYRAEFNESMQRLLGLMKEAGRRSNEWIGQAIRARERAERDYANYRGAADSLASLLDGLPAIHAKLAAAMDPALLLEEGLRKTVRDQALSAVRAAESEIQEARRFAIRN